jgi:N utilization substance protein A
MLLIIQVTFNYILQELSPAKVSSIKINEETKRAEVFFKIRRGSKAIGRRGGQQQISGFINRV